MSPMPISWIVFACVFTGALLGMLLRAILPQHHLNPDSKNFMKLGMGLIATMAALVLGLLVASAKNSYDTQRSDLVSVSANVMLLDRALVHYGPETKDARDMLRREVALVIGQIWPQDSSQLSQLEPKAGAGENLYDKIQGLIPQNDIQRALQSDAHSLALDIGKTRNLMFEQRGSSIPTPLLVILVFWLMTLFVSFGLSAPSNATAFVTLLVCALSVAGAIFLILELDRPFEGLIQVSSAPLRSALVHLSQ